MGLEIGISLHGLAPFLTISVQVISFKVYQSTWYGMVYSCRGSHHLCLADEVLDIIEPVTCTLDKTNDRI